MTIDRHVDKTKPRFTQLEKIPWEGEFLVNAALMSRYVHKIEISLVGIEHLSKEKKEIN